MKFLDLCAGIGGFSLGLEWAGMTCAGQVEIDPFCISILEKHWPRVPRWKDLKDERILDELPAVDLVCGGYPCQPFSTAGKRRGAEDDRHLWPFVFAVVRRLRPAWCLFENVAGHVTLGLDAVLACLEGEGYACRPVVVPACAVDAPHRRDRVWIIANAADQSIERSPAGVLREQPRRISETGGEDIRQPNRKAGADLITANGEVVANAHGDGCEAAPASWEREHRPSGSGEVDGDGEGMVSDAYGAGREERHAAAVAAGSGHDPRSSAARGCFWLPEPGVGRVAHGVPGRVAKLKALGNAVVPQVVMQFGLAILAGEEVVK